MKIIKFKHISGTQFYSKEYNQKLYHFLGFTKFKMVLVKPKI